MNNCSIIKAKGPEVRDLMAGLSWAALMGLVIFPCLGIIPVGYTGWYTDPPVKYTDLAGGTGRRRPGRRCRWSFQWQAARDYGGRHLPQVGWGTWLMVTLSAPLPVRDWAVGVLGLPIIRWLVAVSAVAWPWWGRSGLCRGLRWGLYRLYQLEVLILAAVSVYHVGQGMSDGWASSLKGEGESLLLLGSLTAGSAPVGIVREAKGWRASIEEQEDGVYEVTLTGPQGDPLTIRYRPGDKFERRMLLNFLRHIWTPEDTPARPFLRQEWLATAFDTHQELISRWESYREAGDWRRLMSRRGGPLMNLDEVQEVVNAWAPNFWWTAEEVQTHLAEQGVTYSLTQIKEAGRLSGFSQVRRRLRERFHLGPEAVKPKDGWLVRRLFDQVEALLSKVEEGEGLTPEERLDIGTLQAQREALGFTPGTELEKSLPWLYQVQHVLFGWWEEMEGNSVQCTYCGGTQVARKSATPRYKRYYDAEEKLQEEAVYRYYCKNPACPYKTFTNLPPGLVPYSQWSLGKHLMALQDYAWGRSVYRRVGQRLEVSTATAYRWVSVWGTELLPVAALFGVVRSSGVVGVDEKWVKVPKNDKPAGKRKKWMYVYFAVDVHTYDLLHIEIFPYLGKKSARAFLLALKAKGYQPRAIVTDLSDDYDEPIAQVFPKARHHQCIFHATQWAQRQIKEVYGADYEDEHPEAVQLKEDIYDLFRCKDKRTAQRRYRKLMDQREAYVEAMPEATAIFNSLETHWPKLVNAMGSRILPKTNNAAELVIRRFDQHYQNFCGFESIETARRYLAVFEMVYRFTPFAQDNAKDRERAPGARIGGKCPLELAGYEVRKLPIAQICRGQFLGWPDETLAELVPNA